MTNHHCVKNVQIRSFFWSIFFHIWTEHGDLRSKSPYSIQIREKTNQKKLHIWALFTQCIYPIMTKYATEGTTNMKSFHKNTKALLARYHF